MGWGEGSVDKVQVGGAEFRFLAPSEKLGGNFTWGNEGGQSQVVLRGPMVSHSSRFREQTCL